MPKRTTNLGTILPGVASPSVGSLGSYDCVAATLWQNTQNCVVLAAEIVVVSSLAYGDAVLFGLSSGYSADEVEEAIEAAGPSYRNQQVEEERAERHRTIRWLGVSPDMAAPSDADVDDVVTEYRLHRFENLKLRVNEDQDLNVWAFNITAGPLDAGAGISFRPKLLVRWDP